VTADDGAGAANSDVVIIGAGPAGLAAAIRLADAGLRVVVLDEQPRVGGQIMRQPPREFSVRQWMDDAAYRALKTLVARAEADTRIDWRPGCTVWGLFRSTQAQGGFDIRYVQRDRSEILSSPRVLVAAGCTEMPAPFPGWQLPGVMGAGALQSFYKSQQLVVGQRIVLAGSHPLLLVVAQQLARAGGEVAGVFFAQPWQRVLQAFKQPGALAAGAPQLLQAAGLLVDLRRRGIALHFSACVTAARGTDRLESIEWASVSGDMPRQDARRSLACDALGVSYGFQPASELARLAGADCVPAPGGGWSVCSDADGRSTVPGLYVAGEQTGIKGAASALVDGTLAALAILSDAGVIEPVGVELRRGRASSTRQRRFAAMLTRLSTMPDDFFRALMTDDTLVCRCEDIERRQIDDTLAGNTLLRGASATKLLTRAGMGLCQGRYCETTVRRLLRGQRGADPGAFRPRAPVRPVPVDALCRSADATAIRWDDLHSCNDPEHR
jgi:thioredoxin reductase